MATRQRRTPQAAKFAILDAAERRLHDEGPEGVRIPEKATTLSGAWRPRDPVDDDQGGARA